MITKDDFKVRGASEFYIDNGSGFAQFKVKTNFGWAEVTIYKSQES